MHRVRRRELSSLHAHRAKTEVVTSTYMRYIKDAIVCSEPHFVRARERELNMIRFTRTVRRMHLSLLRVSHCVHDRVYVVPRAENIVVLFKMLDELAT